MSASPSSPNDSAPNRTAGSADDEQARKSQAAAMERFAEVSLKSVPLPEGVDPNKRATVGEAFKTIKSDDLLKVHQTPCSRDGFLTGIGSGAAVGFLRYIIGAPVPKSANWAVGSGVAMSILAYEYCQYQRRVERANMKRVVEVVSKKQAETRKQEEEKKLQNNMEKVTPANKTTGRAWYKFW
ncbi:hypothetical protein J7T55_005516 [Diaporthe amygdali]|uniref:uncharacterized protein n=1 Tax=Phomopsis amygdali TaxID=1214568 RepID=UPI0022FE58F0|nr:uncharacterized protein J7T55_005516 [Diaporthe amygdali]KAJ0108968.1 hypothetical protein J7T55_005516 [Diaporthe amygdali]